MKTPLLFAAIFALFFSVGLAACASSGAASAEEYFSLGMDYFNLGKYEEAERLLNRARMLDKTKTASEYNLGRIAFELGRYDDAAKRFDRILARDKDNVMALKAAAYARIKLRDLAAAEAFYGRVLALEPDSADQGYNYALVLMAMDKPEQAEEVLLKYKIAMADNKDTLLLLARAQRALNKVEAVDAYSQWLQDNSDAAVRYEYAQALESGEFYARALEEYQAVIAALPKTASSPVAGTKGDSAPNRASVRFAAARLLLIADPEKADGITELETAVSEGFADTEKLRALLDEGGISAAHKDEVRRVIDGIEKAAAQQAAAKKDTAEETAEQEPVEQIPSETDGGESGAVP